MAEKGAHLTLTSQLKPSLFDFIAQHSLNDLLQPAIRKVIEVLALRNDTFKTILKWFDEFFLVNYFLLQYYYLSKFGGTFAESFYGLKRVPTRSIKQTLGKKELQLSLLFITLLPYLRSKLNQTAEKAYLDELPDAIQKKKVFTKSVIGLSSGLQIVCQIVNFIQHLRYLSGKSDYNSLQLWASGVKLQYADEEEPASNIFSLRNFIPQLLRRSFEISAFFLQFYQWWTTEQVGKLGTLPSPPPPVKQDNIERWKGICPICHKKRISETALSVSGYVFCFRCITGYLQQNNKCPVTNLPANVNNLICLYPPE